MASCPTSDVLLDEGENIEAITARFRKNLTGYWLEVGQEAVGDLIYHQGYIRWVQVGAVLAKTPGVKDYDRSAGVSRCASPPTTRGVHPIPVQ